MDSLTVCVPCKVDLRVFRLLLLLLYKNLQIVLTKQKQTRRHVN